MQLLMRACLVWSGMLTLALTMGFIRRRWLEEPLGLTDSSLITGFVTIAIVLVIVPLSRRWIGLFRRRETWQVGFLWFGLTLAAELAYLVMVRDYTVAQLIDVHTFQDGSLVPLILLCVSVAPGLLLAILGPEPLSDL